MKVEVLKVTGYEEAFFGIGLSYGITSGLDYLSFDMDSVFYEATDEMFKKREKLKQIASNLAHKGNGENKFLRQIQVWLDITAPRYWWCEFDTYKVGTTAQSESTMHTICKFPFTKETFEGLNVNQTTVDLLENHRQRYVNEGDKEAWYKLKQNLPESFLQRRIVNLNYAVLQNMLQQRYNHRLPEWKFFCKTVAYKIPYSSFIIPRRSDGSSVDLYGKGDRESK